MALRAYVALVVEFLRREDVPTRYHERAHATYVSEIGIDLASHLRHPPFDHVAEHLVVNVVVLPSDRPLCALLELVLSVAEGRE